MRGKNGHTKPPPLTNPLTHDLEVRTAERDRALDALERLLKTIPQEFAPMESQQAVWQARAVLVEQGRITTPPRAIWVDREPRK